MSHRQRVQKAPREGLVIPGVSGSTTLPEDFVEEALIISDLLDLNEISAVELLLAGEQHMPRSIHFSKYSFSSLAVTILHLLSFPHSHTVMTAGFQV